MGEKQSIGKIGKYTLIKTLNSTGNSSVYFALESEFHAPVALKVFPVDQHTPIEIEEFFLNQFRVAQNVSNQFLVKTLEVNDGPDQPHAVMEYNPGQSLRELIDSGNLTVKRSCRIIAKVAIAVSSLHEAGITHLNIQPKNILIRENGTPCLVGIGSNPKLLSSEEIADSNKTQSELVYIAPEQFTGLSECDNKSDLYSLGVILYETLTGQVPFHAENVDQLIKKIIRSTPKSPSRLIQEVDSTLAKICLRAIQKNPEERYISVKEFSQTLKTYLKNNSSKTSKSFKRSKSRTKKKRGNPMSSSLLKLIAGIGCGLALIVALFIGIAKSGLLDKAEPEIVEAPEEDLSSKDQFASEVIIDFSMQQFLTSFEKNELSASKWYAKLKELPDTEEAAKCLMRFFNASVANPDLIKLSAKEKGANIGIGEMGVLGAAPSVTAELPERVLKLIQRNSSPLTFKFLEVLSINEPMGEVDVADEVPSHLRNTAAMLLLRDDHDLDPEVECQLSFRHKYGNAKRLLAAVPVKENPEDELLLLGKLMQELIESPSSNQTFLLGSHGGSASLNSYAKAAGEIAVINRIADVNTEAANQYLFELLKMKSKGNKRNALPVDAQSEIVRLLIEKDDEETVVDKLAEIIAEQKLRSNRPGTDPANSQAIQLQTNNFGPMLRRKLVEKYWGRESIQQDRLLDLIPFHHAASFPAIKYLYSTSNISAEIRDVIESRIAKNAMYSTGIAIGWISADPEADDSDRPFVSTQNKMLLGETNPLQNLPKNEQIHMTLALQPKVENWLNDDQLLHQIVKRMKGSTTQRMILLDVLASTMHPIARQTFKEEVRLFADVGPDEFAGQPISLAVTPEEVARSLRVPQPNKKDFISHNGWGDPWSIVAMKEPKRIRPPQKQTEQSKSRRSRHRPPNGEAKKTLTPREVQQAWFVAVLEVVEAWHERCSLAISKLPPKVPELNGAVEKLSLQFPEDVNIRRQILWNSEENSRGLIPLPEGHQIGFIEFDTKEHPKRTKQLFEELYPTELSLGNESWTDITIEENGIERNIDIIYHEDNGITKGSFLILERPLDD